jgi:hypothetical protein
MGIQLTQVGHRPTPLLPWTGDSMGDHDLDARAAYDSPHCCQRAARSEVGSARGVPGGQAPRNLIMDNPLSPRQSPSVRVLGLWKWPSGPRQRTTECWRRALVCRSRRGDLNLRMRARRRVGLGLQASHALGGQVAGGRAVRLCAPAPGCRRSPCGWSWRMTEVRPSRPRRRQTRRSQR